MKTLSLSCLSLQATQALRYKMKTYTYVFMLMADLNPDLVSMGYINKDTLSAQRLALLRKLVRDLYDSERNKFSILEPLVTSLCEKPTALTEDQLYKKLDQLGAADPKSRLPIKTGGRYPKHKGNDGRQTALLAQRGKSWRQHYLEKRNKGTCKDLLQGKCTKGIENCPFAHPVSEISKTACINCGAEGHRGQECPLIQHFRTKKKRTVTDTAKLATNGSPSGRASKRKRQKQNKEIRALKAKIVEHEKTLDKIRNMEGTFTLSKGAFSPVSETSGRALGASSSYQSALSGRARGSSSSSGAGVRFNTGSSSGEPVLQI